jgi:hypothetical protein
VTSTQPRSDGALHVATDGRDFHQEVREEAADGLVLTEVALLGPDKRRTRGL